MSSWMNDAAPVQNHNGAAFNHLSDPNSAAGMIDPSAYLQNSAAFDPSQFQNQQLQQRMQNGGMRNPSPAFNSPAYQTQPVVPSKRPRPREDSLGTSPRQAPGLLPLSRSQTPQQNAYANFQAGGPGAQPNPYSHLQPNGSNNPSPSPVMANQLRPGSVPQRVSTASPHPFSPAAQQFGSQASPSQSEHGNRVDSTQSMPYPLNPALMQSYDQAFARPGRTSAPSVSMPGAHMQQTHMPQMYPQPPQGMNPQNAQQIEQQKAMYQLRIQQQQQQMAMMQAQKMQNPQNMNPMMRAQMQSQNGQIPPGMRPQLAQVARSQTNPETFMRTLQQYMQARGLPLEVYPIVDNRPMPIMNLYVVVSKMGGYARVTNENKWGHVAQALNINPVQNQQAPHQLRGLYERNLKMFEDAMQQQQRQKMEAGMMGQHPQMSPTKMGPQSQMLNPQDPQYLQQVRHQQMLRQQLMQQQQKPMTPAKQMTPMQSAQQPQVNGFSTPHAQAQHQMPPSAQPHARSMSRSVEATPTPNGSAFPIPSPASASKHGSLSLPSPHPDGDLKPAAINKGPETVELDAVFNPRVRIVDSWGGVNVEALQTLGDNVLHFKPNVPSVLELGLVDIHALTMSLQSGIHAEVRLALDTLATLSVEQRLQLDLRLCDELVEALIDCAEDQVELLAENAAEVSDDMLVISYEDVVRGSRAENELLPDVPVFGSLESNLDRAVDRLICITTILRNLSFYETNHPLLADELVIKFLCVVIRHLGTRNMLLRTNASTLDFMKDVIIFLSNLSQAIELPSREQALCLLHFLLAFAPGPQPNSASSDRVMFSPYDPQVHRYLPPAVDSLAKLLARDEPNRSFYKAIFAADVASPPPYDLLTRTFGLAISPTPDCTMEIKRGNSMPIIDARKPYLMQGMLAADILSSLAPGNESKLARSWLLSEDGFAANLLRLVVILMADQGQQPAVHQRGAPQGRVLEDEAIQHITLGGVSVLRRLSEKARNHEDPKNGLPLYVLPSQDMLLDALRMRHNRPESNREVLKQLLALGNLDN